MQAKFGFGKLLSLPVDDISTLTESQTLGWQIKAYNFPEIWSETKGKGVKVAVLDTAVDTGHPDIKISGGFDFVHNTDINGRVPTIGHGTHVCGIIGAKDNQRGMVGVAPECELYSLTVLDDDGRGDYDWIIGALEWCVENNMDVINMSLGGSMDTTGLYEAIRKTYDAGIPVIAAAGNSAWETGYLDFPGTYNETIAIASITKDFVRSNFSSIGPNIDICAPGSDILSSIPGSDYAIYSGTSMATPFVSGLVALMIAKHRMYGGKTPIDCVEDVREHLIKEAEDVSYEGRDNYTGYGLVNPVGSFNYDDGDNDKPVPEEPAGPEEESVNETPTNEPSLFSMFLDFIRRIFGRR